jgi:hypothetical protein
VEIEGREDRLIEKSRTLPQDVGCHRRHILKAVVIARRVR